jgi:hypothetical protein
VKILGRTALGITAAAIGVLSLGAPAMASVNPQAVNNGGYPRADRQACPPPRVHVPPFQQACPPQFYGCYHLHIQCGHNRPYEHRQPSTGYEFVMITSADGIHFQVTLSGTFSDYGTGVKVSDTQDIWTFPNGTLSVSYSQTLGNPTHNGHEGIESETFSGLYHITQGTGELEGWTSTGSFTANELIRFQRGSAKPMVLSYTLNGQGAVQDSVFQI